MASESRREAVRDLQPVADLMRMLADGTRLKLLLILAERGESNVTDLCKSVGVVQPTVSHHLGLLRMGGLVAARRRGKQIFYHLEAEPPGHGLLRFGAGGTTVSVRRG